MQDSAATRPDEAAISAASRDHDGSEALEDASTREVDHSEPARDPDQAQTVLQETAVQEEEAAAPDGVGEVDALSAALAVRGGDLISMVMAGDLPAALMGASGTSPEGAQNSGLEEPAVAAVAAASAAAPDSAAERGNDEEADRSAAGAAAATACVDPAADASLPTAAEVAADDSQPPISVPGGGAAEAGAKSAAAKDSSATAGSPSGTLPGTTDTTRLVDGATAQQARGSIAQEFSTVAGPSGDRLDTTYTCVFCNLTFPSADDFALHEVLPCHFAELERSMKVVVQEDMLGNEWRIEPVRLHRMFAELGHGTDDYCCLCKAQVSRWMLPGTKKHSCTFCDDMLPLFLSRQSTVPFV